MNVWRTTDVLVAVLLLCPAVGCQTGKPADMQAREAETQPSPADAMAQSDADRAKAAIERNQRTGDQPPAAPPSRTGTRTVDQPRRGRP